jgi:tripartite-type tricarboxylate transporter receptor subunit TctC
LIIQKTASSIDVERREKNMPRNSGTVMTRRSAILGGLTLAAAPALGQSAWPNRPVTLVVPFAAGGGVDVTSRLIAEALADQLGQRLVVENRGGGATIPATQAVINAAPDGYTLLAAPTTLVINPAFRASMPFNWATQLAPLGLMAKLPFAVVMRADAKASTMKELEALARAAPKPLTFASGGTGTVAHLAGELFASRTGIKLQHIPFRGEGPAVNDLIAGHLDVGFATLAAVAGFVEAGALKALAVTTTERARLLPKALTVAEQGYPDYDVSAWIALTAPAGTPSDVTTRLKQALTAAVAQPALNERLQRIGAVPASPDTDVASFMQREAMTWAKVIGDAGIKVDL